MALASPGTPVGVDLVGLGHVRQPELVAQSLAEHEQVLVDGLAGAELDERVLRLWCAKEAAAKCLGIGLQGEPAAFAIRQADDACECMRIEHAMGVVDTRVVRRGNTVIAVATPAITTELEACA